MLSYRHAFHAGNFADVLKHTVLVQVLRHMQNKEKGFSYIDTHAGAGMYRLADEVANKTAEYRQGIEKLWDSHALEEGLSAYIECIKDLNKDSHLSVYPGSPSIAEYFMRKQDSAFLYDLHPADYRLLSELFAGHRKIKTFKSDGYQALKAHLPPATRRGVVLIDPPYELKTDYRDAVDAIIKGYRLFASGVFVLWYPVVDRHYITEMQNQLSNSAVRNVLQLEFRMQPDHGDFGMTGSGLFVVNPPWTLKAQAENFMPYLVDKLGSVQSDFTVRQLIEE